MKILRLGQHYTWRPEPWIIGSSHRRSCFDHPRVSPPEGSGVRPWPSTEGKNHENFSAPTCFPDPGAPGGDGWQVGDQAHQCRAKLNQLQVTETRIIKNPANFMFDYYDVTEHITAAALPFVTPPTRFWQVLLTEQGTTRREKTWSGELSSYMSRTCNNQFPSGGSWRCWDRSGERFKAARSPSTATTEKAWRML